MRGLHTCEKLHCRERHTSEWQAKLLQTGLRQAAWCQGWQQCKAVSPGKRNTL